MYVVCILCTGSHRLAKQTALRIATWKLSPSRLARLPCPPTKGTSGPKRSAWSCPTWMFFVFVASLGFLWYPMITVDHGGKGATMQLYYLKRWFSFREMLNLRRDSSWFICSIMILTPTLQFIWGRTRVQNEHLPSNALNCWFTVPCWRSNSAAASATLGKSNKKVAGNCRPAQSPSLLAILEVSFCDHSESTLKRTWNGKDLKHRNNDMKRMQKCSWYDMKWRGFFFIQFIHPEKRFEDSRVTGRLPKFQIQIVK